MAYAHVAHDCVLGDHVIMANAVQLGGHVSIADWAILGGSVVAHQFTLIGAHAMIGGGFRVTQDVPPYAIVGGYPCRVLKVNRVGLERRGFTPEQTKALSHAFRVIFRSGLNLTQALDKLKNEGTMTAEVEHLIDFFALSKRGVMR
jgi:UDP-N-acetylglucosamine acyltransferase